jgi:hypothetical protein
VKSNKGIRLDFCSFTYLLILGIIAFGTDCRAGLILSPRVDAFQAVTPVSQRNYLRTQISKSGEYTALFGEASAEYESQPNQLRLEGQSSRADLHELYFDLKLDAFLLRVGRQALRWSDMWVTPSLDVWTARKSTRLLLDPVAEQLVHSTGAQFAWTSEHWAIENFVSWIPARDEYPAPFPPHPYENPEEVSRGSRIKVEQDGFGMALSGSRVAYKDTYGLSLNYAFEQWVPKFETGRIWNRNYQNLSIEKRQEFYALGADIFFGNWTLQPQATYFDFGDLDEDSKDFQSVYYLSGTWQHKKYEFQFQTFRNTSSKDSFLGLTSSFNLADWLQISGLAQYYDGRDNSLFGRVNEIYGSGWVAGLRLQMNTQFDF